MCPHKIQTPPPPARALQKVTDGVKEIEYFTVIWSNWFLMGAGSFPKPQPSILIHFVFETGSHPIILGIAVLASLQDSGCEGLIF